MNKVEENFQDLIKASIKQIRQGEKVTGSIIEINDKDEIFVDIGYKSDGIIPKSEYCFDNNSRPNDEFKVGDLITAEIIKINDGMGNVLLSYKKVKNMNIKRDFQEKVKNNKIFEEKINQIKDKGFIVIYNEIRIFIPLSLSGITREENIEQYKDKQIKFKIIECDLRNNRVIGSVKAVIDEEKEIKQKEFWDRVEQGKLYKGIITSISSYGAFVDIGGVQGLLHISEVSWSKNIVLSDVLKVGQEIEVRVKLVDKENKRISLIYEGKGTYPWENIENKYNINDIVKVKVVKLVPFGVFAELEPGIEGLIHISQISEQRIVKPEEKLKIGQHVNTKIIELDKQNKKIELSIRELEGTSNEYIEEI